ncbi:hypothetical protein [Citricoccus alkalitolerans]|uniref:ATP synthase protein I n=1 Tax=Citricoccus alkalitolerans TaxID=246603 RepID=A0ABV8XY02_9MICC
MKTSAKRVNTRGWWGILVACLIGSVAALAVAVVIAWLVVGRTAGGTAAASLGLAGAAVVVLSGLTLLVTAWSWDRWREQAVFIALFGFVLKIILMAVLLTVVPPPVWLDTMAAGLGALVAIVAWQVTEVFVFARTRQQIYDD